MNVQEKVYKTERENQWLNLLQIESQKLENSMIQDILDSDDDTDYIAEIAREKLGYIIPGQRVFVDISSK